MFTFMALKEFYRPALAVNILPNSGKIKQVSD